MREPRAYFPRWQLRRTLNASNNGQCTRANGQNVFIQPNAVEEHSLPEGVRIFPNPTSGQLGVATYLVSDKRLNSRQEWLAQQRQAMAMCNTSRSLPVQLSMPKEKD